MFVGLWSLWVWPLFPRVARRGTPLPNPHLFHGCCGPGLSPAPRPAPLRRGGRNPTESRECGHGAAHVWGALRPSRGAAGQRHGSAAHPLVAQCGWGGAGAGRGRTRGAGDQEQESCKQGQGSQSAASLPTIRNPHRPAEGDCSRPPKAKGCQRPTPADGTVPRARTPRTAVPRPEMDVLSRCHHCLPSFCELVTGPSHKPPFTPPSGRPSSPHPRPFRS